MKIKLVTDRALVESCCLLVRTKRYQLFVWRETWRIKWRITDAY